MIVDSHAHCAVDMLEPVEKLLEQMDAHDVRRALLLPHRTATDQTHLIDCKRRFPGRFSVSCRVDASSAAALPDLERWHARGAEDVRLAFNDRSPGTAPFEIWKKVSDLGMTAHVGAGAAQSYAGDAFATLLQDLPKLRFVFEHMMGLGLKPTPTRPRSTEDDFESALSLARFPNTYIKIHGMGEISEPPAPHGNAGPYLRMAYDAFGPRRMMWGSDWPFVLQNESYAEALHLPQEHLSFCSVDDREWIFGKTALSLWQFT